MNEPIIKCDIYLVRERERFKSSFALSITELPLGPHGISMCNVIQFNSNRFDSIRGFHVSITSTWINQMNSVSLKYLSEQFFLRIKNFLQKFSNVFFSAVQCLCNIINNTITIKAITNQRRRKKCLVRFTAASSQLNTKYDLNL